MTGSKILYEKVEVLNNRGTFVPPSQLVPSPDKELYRSYFGVSPDIVEHILTGRKTAMGFVGKFYLPNIVLDLDKGGNSPEYTFEQAKDFYRRLESEFVKPLVFFSGSGYHFVIPDIFGFEPSSELPSIVKNTLDSLFPEIDTKPINPRGLIRMNFSLNKKTGLYKTYIENLMDVELDYIYEISREQNIVKLPKLAKKSKMFSNYIVYKQTTKEAIPQIEFNNMFPCMQAVYKEGEVIGTRHNRILRLASWQRRNGTPIEATIAMMRSYAPSLSEYEITKTVKDVYKKGYSYSCNDNLLKQYCKSNCIFYSKKEIDSVVSADKLEKSFYQYMTNKWKDESINLKSFVGSDFYIPPESFVGVIGGIGLNKTAFVQNIAVESSSLAPILYINTEFGHNILYRRFVQIACKMTKEQIEEHYKYNSNTLSHNLEHLIFLNKIPDIDQIKELVKKYHPKVLMIDVIDDIIKRGMRGLESEEAVAREMNDLAKQCGIIVVAVHHIAKSEAFDGYGKSKSLTTYSSKGTSVFPQKCDILIGIEGDASDTLRIIKSLKGRDNKPFFVTKRIDPSTMTFK